MGSTGKWSGGRATTIARAIPNFRPMPAYGGGCLKGTLKLEQLTCTSPEMIAKEIHAAMITYNLVRAVMYAAAAQSGLAPRGYSFARVRHVVEHFLPFIAAAQTPEEAQALTDKMMECVGQKKLRNRKGRRSYPRAAWGRPRTFPCRK